MRCLSIVCLFSVLQFAIAQTGIRKDLTAYPEAKCLDGTPGAYYYRLNATSPNWIIFHEGGGWSYNFEDAEKRSTTEFGSANYFPKTMWLSGILSGNKTENIFYDWNAVYLKYCDGSSFSSYRAEPVLYDSEYLYFRGKAILTAVMTDIKSNFPIAQAKNIIISGCSAGGLATYLHLDWWRANLPQTARVVGIPDAGWFFDAVNVDGYYIYAESMRSGFELWNASEGVNSDCIKNYSTSAESWKCVLAQYTYPFIQTPIFVLNARYDAWSALNILQLLCVLYQQPVIYCPSDEMKTYLNWGNDAQMTILQVAKPQQNGLFLDACNYHCQTQDNSWSLTKVDGISIMQAFSGWLFGGNRTFIDSAGYGVNPTCPENLFPPN